MRRLKLKTPIHRPAGGLSRSAYLQRYGTGLRERVRYLRRDGERVRVRERVRDRLRRLLQKKILFNLCVNPENVLIEKILQTLGQF